MPDGGAVSVSVSLYAWTHYLGILNAFITSRDNINDVFFSVDLSSQALKFFCIYNCWGEVIFDSLGG